MGESYVPVESTFTYYILSAFSMLSLGSQQPKQSMNCKSNFIFCWLVLKKRKKKERKKKKRNGIWTVAAVLGNAQIH